MQVARRGTAPPPGSPDKRSFWLRVQVGARRIHRSLRTRDQRVAMERAAQLIARAQRGALGLEDPVRDQLVKPIAQHLSDFEAVLRAGEVGDEHLRDRRKALSDYVAFAKVRRLPDLDQSSASRWLSGLRDRGLSARTVNKRAAALRQFGKWAQACRRIEHNPFASLPLQKEKLDRRRVRRALTFDEFHSLLRAARTRPLEEARRYRVRQGVTHAERVRLLALGRTRALVYSMAATTALRREELAGLTWGRSISTVPSLPSPPPGPSPRWISGSRSTFVW